MMKKYRKGEYGYLKYKKKKELLKTVLMFGISALVFLLGLISTKTKANYLTIVAVLGCLPASKSAVSMIMYLKIRECSQKFSEIIMTKFPSAGSFHLYFTTYDRNFPTAHVFVKALTLIAYTENQNVDEKAFEEHILTLLKRDGIKGCHVKLFKDSEKYVQRMEQMMCLENDKETDVRIVNTLHAVSL